MGYKYRSVADKVILTPKQKERGVETVKAWICKNVYLDKVIFSDECKFTLNGNEGSKKYHPWKTKKDFPGRIHNVTELHIPRRTANTTKIEGTLTSTKYFSRPHFRKGAISFLIKTMSNI